MIPLATIISGVHLAGLDGLVLLLTVVVIGSAILLGRADSADAKPERVSTKPAIPTSPPAARRAARALPNAFLERAATLLIFLAALALLSTGEVNLRPRWSAPIPVVLALAGMAAALFGGELAREYKLSDRWRALMRLATGVALIVAGQLAAGQNAPVLMRFEFGPRAIRYFRLDTTNFDNLSMALFCFLVGMLLVTRGAFVWAESEPVAERRAAPALRTTGGRLRAAPALILAAVALGIPLIELHAGRYSSFDLAGWIASMALLIWATFSLDRLAGVRFSLDADRYDVVAVALLLAAGVAIGVHRLATVPNSLMGDEGRFFETAAAIARGYRPPIFGAGVYDFPMLSSYFQAGILGLTGVTLWGWRFSALVPALAVVVPTYLLARELFDRRVAIASGAMLMTLPYFLSFARLGYNNSQALAPVAAAVFLAYAGIRRGSYCYLALSGIAAGAGFYTYGGGRLGLIVVPLYLIALAIASRRANETEPASSYLRQGIAFLAGCFAAASPLVVYGESVYPVRFRAKTLEALMMNAQYGRSLFTDAQLFRDHAPITIDGQQFFYNPGIYLELFGRGLFRSTLAFASKSFIGEHFIAAPLAGPLGFALVLIGIGVALGRGVRHRGGLLAIWFVAGLLILAALDSFPPRQAHLVPVIPVVAILAAVGLVTIADQLAALLRWRPKYVSVAICAVAVLVVAALGLRNYFVVMPDRYPPTLEDVAIFTAQDAGASETLLWVYDNADGREYIPWGIANLPSKATFKNISSADLTTGRLKLAPGTVYSVIWTPVTNDAVSSALARLTGAAIDPIVHRTYTGDILGYSLTFTAPPSSGSAPGSAVKPNSEWPVGARLGILNSGGRLGLAASFSVRALEPS